MAEARKVIAAQAIFARKAISENTEGQAAENPISVFLVFSRLEPVSEPIFLHDIDSGEVLFAAPGGTVDVTQGGSIVDHHMGCDGIQKLFLLQIIEVKNRLIQNGGVIQMHDADCTLFEFREIEFLCKFFKRLMQRV